MLPLVPRLPVPPPPPHCTSPVLLLTVHFILYYSSLITRALLWSNCARATHYSLVPMHWGRFLHMNTLHCTEEAAAAFHHYQCTEITAMQFTEPGLTSHCTALCISVCIVQAHWIVQAHSELNGRTVWFRVDLQATSSLGLTRLHDAQLGAFTLHSIYIFISLLPDCFPLTKQISWAIQHFKCTSAPPLIWHGQAPPY